SACCFFGFESRILLYGAAGGLGEEIGRGPTDLLMLIELRLDHLEFDGKRRTLTLLLAGQIVQPLAADHASPAILHEYHIISDFLANGLLRRIIKPDRQRVARPIIVNSHFVHRSVPLFMLLVK